MCLFRFSNDEKPTSVSFTTFGTLPLVFIMYNGSSKSLMLNSVERFLAIFHDAAPFESDTLIITDAFIEISHGETCSTDKLIASRPIPMPIFSACILILCVQFVKE